jgi:hypothetical protein
MTGRIALTHLTFAGAAVQPASVEFGPSVTVIRGPSDTGKSFIADAIDFMLGGSKPLDDIPERAGYTSVLLGLRLPDDHRVTLVRSVDGGRFALYEGDTRTPPAEPSEQVLNERHVTGKRGSLSAYLLNVLDLEGKRVRKNMYNHTNELSFRNVAHLCVVDETSMQATRSPVLTAVTTSKTVDISVLKLLLEGQDDSALVPVPTAKERRQTSVAQETVVSKLVADLEAQLEGTASPTELRAQLDRLSSSARTFTDSISAISADRDQLGRRIAATERQRLAELERFTEVSALTARFHLLDDQYSSDLQRLEMISEAGSLLGYFRSGTCAFCGADVEHQHYNENLLEGTTAFRDSVLTEQSKTMNLQADLRATLSDLETEHAALARRIEAMQRAIDSARERLEGYDSSLAPNREGLAELLDKRSEVERLRGLYDQIDSLERLRRQVAHDQERETAVAAEGMQLVTVAAFSAAISERLAAWGVPDAGDTRYDRSEQDIISGNQSRASHGKGVRAVLHAAFTLALTQYCYDRDLPHPGFVVLDSPLVTYRPPEQGGDADGTLPDSVIGRFYADIQNGVGGQVIVLENIEPPNGLGPLSLDVSFTKNRSRGRYGFFPPSNS